MDETDSQNQPASKAHRLAEGTIARGKRRTPWRRWAFLAVALLVLWFSPWLLLNSPLRNPLLNQLLGDFQGELKVDGASAGWLSPIRLRGIQLLTSDGETLARVDEVRSQRALLSLLTHLSAPGEFSIERPRLYLHRKEELFAGEEDLLSWLTTGESDGELESLTLNIREAEIHLSESDREDQYQLTSPQLTVKIASGKPQVAGSLQAAATDGSPRGELTFAVNGAETKDDSNGEVSLTNDRIDIKADSFDLEWAGPIIRRWDGHAEVAGSLHGKANITPDSTKNGLAISCENLKLRGLYVESPRFLGQDRVAFDSIAVEGDVALDNDQVATDQLNIKSDIGSLVADGTIPLKLLQQTSFSIGGLPDASVNAQVNVKEVATKFPKLLRIRDDVTIESGTIELTAFSRLEGGERRLFVDLATSRLQADRLGEMITWESPLSISLSAKEVDSKPRVEFLECTTDFLQCTGSGDLRQGTIQGTADLAKLHQQLSRFVDLSTIELSGSVAWSANWSPAESPVNSIMWVSTGEAHHNSRRHVSSTPEAESETRWAAECAVQSPLLRLDDGTQFSLARADLQATGTVAPNGTGEMGLASGEATVTFGKQKIVWRLAQWMPLAWQGAPAGEIELNGDIAELLELLPQPAADQRPLIQGAFAVAGPLRVDDKGLKLDKANLAVNDLLIEQEGVSIHQPQLLGQLSIGYDFATGEVDPTGTEFAGSAVACAVNSWNYSQNESQPAALSGTIALRGDLFQLTEWFPDARTAPYRPFGEFVGELKFQQRENGLLLELNGASDPLIFATRRESTEAVGNTNAPPYVTAWEEEECRLVAKLEYRSAEELVRLQNLRIGTRTLGVTASGTVKELSTSPDLDLSGELRTNLTRLSNRLQTLSPGTIKFEGNNTEPFSIKGRLGSIASADSNPTGTSSGLIPAGLMGSLGASFDRATIMGLDTGGAKLRANLDRQFIVFDPVHLRIGEGFFHCEPRLRLDGTAPVLELEDQRLLNNVELTPEVTRSWIGYSAPIIAAATKAQGKFSVHVDRASIPLDDTFAGSAKGRVMIPQASVGTGPLSDQLIGLARQLRRIIVPEGENLLGDVAVVLPQQSFEYELVNGRMYHDQMLVQLGDLTMSTSGSIGADQSLDLLVSIRPPRSWVAAAGPILQAALSDLQIKVPVRGTLTEPKVDAQSLRELSPSMFREAAGGLLENELKKGLRSLFGNDRE